ncbi:MAG: 30S ribosomal protein S20 [Bacteroidetes bacterium]|nr:30S ribosomal protein S20 [Bacteroidota bacterium]
MAQHQSAKKRIRQTVVKRLRNRYDGKTTRNAIKVLMETTDKGTATELLPKTVALVDKLAKKNIIHSNKAGHIKSKLTKHVNAL